MRKGSITIFLCLVMTVMISLLLGCIFSVKVRAGRAMLENGTDQALFSLLARYDRQMLEDFDVFLLDGGCGTSDFHPEKLSQWAADDLSYIANPSRGRWPFSAKSLFDLSVEACDLTGYTLVTDAGGRIFRDAALRYEKETYVIKTAAAAVNWITSLKDLTDVQMQAYTVVFSALNGGNMDDARAAAENASRQMSEKAAKAADAQAAVSGGGGLAGSGEKMSAVAGEYEKSFSLSAAQIPTGTGKNENLSFDDRNFFLSGTKLSAAAGESKAVFEQMAVDEEEESLAGETFAGEASSVPTGLAEAMPLLSTITSSPILVLTLTDASSMSWRSVWQGELYRSRKHRQGMGVLEVPQSGDSLLDKYMYNEYLLSHLGNRKNPQKDAALFCPAEYLVFGRTEDAKNVECVINQILLFREGVNIAYLMYDPAKNALLKTAGLVLATAAGQPEAANEMAMGLAAAWAYAESLVDLRGLFLGKRNCFLKDSAHWQLDLSDLPAFLTGGLDRLVKGAEAGPGYLDYLRMMLLLENNDTILSRSLDMVELCERGNNRKSFRLDACLANVTVYAEALSEGRIRMSSERSLGYREL